MTLDLAFALSLSQGSIVVAMAPVRQYQLGYVGDYFEVVTQECLCLLFGNMAADFVFGLCYIVKIRKMGLGIFFVSNLLK